MTSTAVDRPHLPGAEHDLSSREFWAKPYAEREQTFRKLREECPISWHRPYESTLQPPEEDTPGFWSVSRWADCREVSRDVKRFVSGEGIIMEDFPEVLRVATNSFLAMDGAEHRQLRGIVGNAFTPRNVKQIEGWIHDHAREIVDEILERGEGDLCAMFTKELPGRIFAHFFGVPQGSEEQQTLMDAAERMLAWDDPECAMGRSALETFAEEAEKIQDIALAVAEERRDAPGDDMVSWVLAAEFEGRKLDDWEIAAFFSLLGSAANDTTRHSIAHAVRLLSEHPDQRELLLADLHGPTVDRCVEEVLRHATPVMHFRRTAIVDTELAGVPIATGDKLVMWYCSGNRDASVFEDPARFDISRDPNHHLGFGAGGPHYCIGAALGRQMIKSSLQEIYTRMPDIDLAGDPEFQVGNFLHGVHRLPVRWTPSA
ncbi:MAG TPA: cytochrome P450 [Baekduia sp.]|nr:cytochrome P450 [Baekduia sp.]